MSDEGAAGMPSAACNAAPPPPPPPAAADLVIALWHQEPPPKLIDRLRASHNGSLGEPAQASLAAALNTPLLRALPPRAAYMSRLLRALLAAAGAADGQGGEGGGGGGALRDDLADAHAAALLAPPDPDGGGWSHRTYCYVQGAEAEAAAPEPAALRQLELAHARTVAAALAASGDGSSSGLEGGGCGGNNDSSVSNNNDSGNNSSGDSGVSGGLVTLRLADDFLRGNTGCAPWEAGFLLAEFALAHPALFRGRRCIDVGAGAGLAGVALWRAGAARVVLADGDAGAVENAARNAGLNGARVAVAPSVWAVDDCDAGNSSALPPAVVCCTMRWEDAATDAAPPLPAFDVVVASDVLYDPACVPAFVRVLHRLLAPRRQQQQEQQQQQQGQQQQQQRQQQHTNGNSETAAASPVAYVASTLRNPETLALFESAARGAGLELSCPLPVGPYPGARFAQPAALSDRSRLRLHRITRPAIAPSS